MANIVLYENMKKVIIYLSITLLIIIVVGGFIVEESIIRVQLPHGAVLHVLPARKNNHARGAVILCPGGGYSYLAKWREGYMWFPFFHCQGYTVAMLEYRIPNHNYRNPMVDGAEAIRLMRTRASEWGFDENNVGIMGFSAGGHLASCLMVNDKSSDRPDFGILFYPVISMKKELTHKGSHNNLLGGNASEQLENQYSSELHISDQTPPAYIAVSSDDKIVIPQNSISFYNEMRAKRRPVVLHVYPSGGHGWGYPLPFSDRRHVLDDLKDWLNNRQQQLKELRK